MAEKDKSLSILSGHKSNGYYYNYNAIPRVSSDNNVAFIRYLHSKSNEEITMNTNDNMYKPSKINNPSQINRFLIKKQNSENISKDYLNNTDNCIITTQTTADNSNRHSYGSLHQPNDNLNRNSYIKEHARKFAISK